MHYYYYYAIWGCWAVLINNVIINVIKCYVKCIYNNNNDVFFIMLCIEDVVSCSSARTNSKTVTETDRDRGAGI